jgi:uncharacterized UPF0160 family protein
MINARSLGTHSGTFHADEVTASALLIYYNLIDKDKIIRTRERALLDKCEYVCDVGGEYDSKRKKFDHHQVSYQGELSSAGMVFSYLKDEGIVSSAKYYFLNRSLVQGVDAHDNGKVTLEPGVCSFSQIISNFVPIRYDSTSKEQDEAFFKALDFVLGHIERSFARFDYMQDCKEKVKAAMEGNGEALCFSESMPWLDVFFELNGRNHPAKFVVMPSGSQWKVRGIPPTSEERMQVRVPLPEKWAGLLEEELREVSGIEGAVFCHKGRFISVWKKREDALKALASALGKEYKEV